MARQSCPGFARGVGLVARRSVWLCACGCWVWARYQSWWRCLCRFGGRASPSPWFCRCVCAGAMATGGVVMSESAVRAMKLAEIKHHLRTLGLSAVGNKSELIIRLLEAPGFIGSNNANSNSQSNRQNFYEKLDDEISKIETEIEKSRLQFEISMAMRNLSHLQVPVTASSPNYPNSNGGARSAVDVRRRTNVMTPMVTAGDGAASRPGLHRQNRNVDRITTVPNVLNVNTNTQLIQPSQPRRVVPVHYHTLPPVSDGPQHNNHVEGQNVATHTIPVAHSAMPVVGGQTRPDGGAVAQVQSRPVSNMSSNLPLVGDNPRERCLLDDTSSQLQSQMTEMANAMQKVSETISMSRLPTPEPPIFTGDPLQYDEWNDAFTSLIEQRARTDADKMYYLKRYVKGRALSAIKAYRSRSSANAYSEAKRVLDERYGSSFRVSEAYRKKLDDWPKIPSYDGQALEEFVDFLVQCQSVMTDISELSFLDDCRQNQRMLQLLPDYIVSRWNQRVVEFELEHSKFPPFKRFVSFLEREAKMACHPVTSLETVKKKTSVKPKPTASHPPNRSVSHAVSDSKAANEEPKQVCLACSKSHKLEDCSQFVSKTQEDRYSLVKSKRACFNCLRPGHSSNYCRATQRCSKCKNKHHTLLHRGSDESSVKANCGSTYALAQQSAGSCLSAMIVPVWVYSRSSPSERWLTYAMLDSQSDATFLTDEVASKVSGVHNATTIKLSTMTSKEKLIKCHRYTDLIVKGYFTDSEVTLPQAYTREFIPHNTDHIPTAEVARSWPHLEAIADQLQPPMNCRVGLLIGYNCPEAIVPVEVLKAQSNQPYGVKTSLGWSIIGCWSSGVPAKVDAVGISHRIMCLEVHPQLQITQSSDSVVECSNSTRLCCKTQVTEMSNNPEDMFRSLEGDFVELGSSSIEYAVSQDDLRFLKTLEQNVVQADGGFYSMPLPFKSDKPIMPNNKSQALRRFNKLKERLSRDENFSQKYFEFMNTIIADGEAERIPETELEAEEVWYLPHHGVTSAKKPGKLRVVFDGSTKFKGHCLNNYLLSGPNLNSNLVGVLTRFRQQPIAVSCDIRKMFHQFRVARKDRDFFRFLWFHPDNNDLIEEYRMTVHLFGSTSSPGCAKFGLNQIVRDHGVDNDEVTAFVTRNFYVDDGLTSCKTVAQAVRLLRETQLILSKGNLKLHKFMANDRQVLENFDRGDWASDDSTSNVCSALGMKWLIDSDEFTFDPPSLKQGRMSRRGMLSTIASIFDPLGLLSPIILVGRLILQQTCRGLGWDDELPDQIQREWQQWIDEVNSLSLIRIDRCLQPKEFGDVTHVELHTFADASLSGYGCCCYLRLRNSSGGVHCSLLFGKSRVVPTSPRKLTVPRLELMAAVLAANLGSKMATELDFKVKHFYYSDSKAVLGYIANSSKRFHMFVANRVSEIRDLSAVESWRHVVGESNPADLASRGLMPSEIFASSWFTGPSFLWQPGEIVAATVDGGSVDDDDPEVRHIAHSVSCSEPYLLSHISRFSRFESAVRFAHLVFHTIKHRWRGAKPCYSVDSLEQSKKWLIRHFQRFWFSDDIHRLSRGKPVSRMSRLLRFDPYLDGDGLLRVGGRVKFSSALLDNEKHPIILAPNSHLTSLLVRHLHELTAHQGRGMTVAAVRSAGYWVIGLSRIVSSLIHHCVRCRVLRRSAESQKMADLPIERLDPTPPFTYVGLDCFGPFHVKDRRKTSKKYGLIFVCMYSRAIHVELLDDLSTDCFINGFRTFIALRGPVRQIKCDKGTNFVGAANELSNAFKEMCEGSVKDYLLQQKCDFVFNTPCSSHMGGAWERLIRTFRSVLTGLLGRVTLDGASARTVMYEAMAIVNSRPLTTVEDGVEPLTPNHLLHMKAGIILPPPGDFPEADVYSRKRWRKVQSLVSEFWNRWRTQYVSSLQQRSKWLKAGRGLRVDDIVLVMDTTVRSEWRLGRVVEVIVSHDGLVRRVRVLVGESSTDKKSTILERPIQKLVLLLEASNSQ